MGVESSRVFCFLKHDNDDELQCKEPNKQEDWWGTAKGKKNVSRKVGVSWVIKTLIAGRSH